MDKGKLDKDGDFQLVSFFICVSQYVSTFAYSLRDFCFKVAQKMQTIAVPAAILAISLTACQSPDAFDSERTRPRTIRGVEYVKPEVASRQPQKKDVFFKNGGIDLFDRYLIGIKQKGLAIRFANKSEGIIQAKRRIDDPTPFVDCGSLKVRGERVLPAAIAQLRYGFNEGRNRFVADRKMRLDAYITLSFGVSEITASSLYALSKQTLAEDRSGTIVARRNETISFTTWEFGKFTSGEVCLSTGALEKSVLSVVDLD
ncbi:MAG: hypothetical protein O7I42_18970 [Alphaproteobacteria bacterium]|nr:hypothetical protein [Alphaproteobacteria bacterium]